jgi:hypothetical protein
MKILSLFDFIKDIDLEVIMRADIQLYNLVHIFSYLINEEDESKDFEYEKSMYILYIKTIRSIHRRIAFNILDLVKVYDYKFNKYINYYIKKDLVNHLKVNEEGLKGILNHIIDELLNNNTSSYKSFLSFAGLYVNFDKGIVHFKDYKPINYIKYVLLNAFFSPLLKDKDFYLKVLKYIRFVESEEACILAVFHKKLLLRDELSSLSVDASSMLTMEMIGQLLY